jgi:hypothetical protein
MTKRLFHAYTLAYEDINTCIREHCLPVQVRAALRTVINSSAFTGQSTGRANCGAESSAFSLLPTLLDIILSYQPPSTLSFHVPVRPEGLPGADSFAVYAGDIDAVSDLAQAQPLQCTVPTGRPPEPGEQLIVPDTLPVPAVGAGKYYVAAVRHGAQIRAGRSSMGGQLRGRNAARLAGCQQLQVRRGE